MLPQIFYLVMVALGLGISLSEHGKPREGKHNLLSAVIANIVLAAILYWGGFFEPLFAK